MTESPIRVDSKEEGRGVRLTTVLRTLRGLGHASRALDDWAPRREPLAPGAVRETGSAIRTYLKSIEATIERSLTDRIAESVNAAIGRLRTNARSCSTA